MNNHLLNKEFLKKLFSSRQRETYAKVISLSLDENPLEELEGKITQGSVNIDGKSAVRRTCNLTFVSTEGTHITTYYWALSNKFKLEIGLKNTIDSNFPEICWFPLGVYIISSFSLNKNSSGFTCSIQGKDKMCLLNGDVGGKLFAQHDFGTIDYINRSGRTERVDLNIEKILREMIHNYAHEPYQNIVIKDIPKYGRFLMTFKGGMDEPLIEDATNEDFYEYHKDYKSVKYTPETKESGGNSQQEKNVCYSFIETTPQNNTNNENIFNLVQNLNICNLGADNIKVKIKNGQWVEYDGVKYQVQKNQEININTQSPTIKLINGPDTNFVFYDNSESVYAENRKATTITYNGVDCVVAKYLPGESIGYKLTELTYPRKSSDDNSGLIGAVGESLTSIIDKVVKMLGDYEYFYNVEGQFVFQKRNSNVDKNWSSNYFENTSLTNAYNMEANLPANLWDFEQGQLVLNYANTPNLGNIKNDFAIWGEAKSRSDNTIPIHLRYAIDVKPTEYNSITVTKDEAAAFKEKHPDIITVKPQTSTKYMSSDSVRVLSKNDRMVDWREVLYQMATDYLKYNHFDSFETKLRDANPELFPFGKTGYEQYYADISGFWRDIYNPGYEFMDEMFVKPTSISKLKFEKNPLDSTKLKNEIFVKGRYELLSKDDKRIPNAYLIPDETKKNAYYIIKDKNGKLVDVVLASNQIGYRMVGYVDENQRVLEPYSAGQQPNTISQTDRTKYFYVKNQGIWPFLSKDSVSLPYRTTNYDIILRVVETNTLDEDIKYVNDNELKLNAYANKNLDFLTVYKYNNNYYMLFTDNNILVKRKIDSQFNSNSDIKTNDSSLAQNFYIRRVGCDGLVSRTKIALREMPVSDYFYYKDNKVEAVVDGKRTYRPIMLDLIDVLEEQKIFDKNYPLIVNEEEEAFSALSLMNPVLRELFIKNSNIFNKNNYLAEFYERERYPSGELKSTSNMIKHPITYYQIGEEILYYENGWQNPETLNFWIDFLDNPYSEMGKLGCKTIMPRLHAINQTEIKAIYYREALQLFIFDKIDSKDLEGMEKHCEKLSTKLDSLYDRINLLNENLKYNENDKSIKEEIEFRQNEIQYSEEKMKELQEIISSYKAQRRLKPYIESTYTCLELEKKLQQYFSISDVGKSCKEVLDEVLYQYGSEINTVSISSVPIYHLEPGDVVSLNDQETMLEGNYFINSISFPLTYNGNMNISATKIISKLY